MTAQRTPLHFFDKLKPQLLDCVQQMLRNDIIDTANYALGGSSPVQARSLFGADESNYNSTYNTALGNIDATNDKLTVAHIRKLRAKAISPSAGFRKIRPTKLRTDNGMLDEYFILLTDPRAFVDLQQDPTWEAIATQGKFEDGAPSFVRGSRYRGMIDNVIIYEEPELSRIDHDTAGASSTAVAHNLFCGGQAFALGIAQMSDFDDEWNDFKNIYELCHSEIRGEGLVMFDNGSGTSYENGLIHSYTTAANGLTEWGRKPPPFN